MTNALSQITSDQLKRAIGIKEQIEALTSEINQIFGSGDTLNSGTMPKKRRMSAAGRAAIRAGQKARWAKERGDKPAATGKRRMSAAARARMSAAAKLRWTAAKAAGKTRL